MPDDRQYSHFAQDRSQAQAARQAAEALFKPKVQAASVEAQTRPVASRIPSTDAAAPRRPRIFSAAHVATPPREEAKPPADLVTRQRPRDTRPKARKIPKSAHGRIKMLTTYGMTVEEVADLYGVATNEVARIVSTAT